MSRFRHCSKTKKDSEVDRKAKGVDNVLSVCSGTITYLSHISSRVCWLSVRFLFPFLLCILQILSVKFHILFFYHLSYNQKSQEPTHEIPSDRPTTNKHGLRIFPSHRLKHPVTKEAKQKPPLPSLRSKHPSAHYTPAFPRAKTNESANLRRRKIRRRIRETQRSQQAGKSTESAEIVRTPAGF